MAKVQLIAEVEPELERLVRVAAESSNKSVSDWVEAAVWLSLEWKVKGFNFSRPGVKPKGSVDPVKLRPGSGTMSDAIIEDREERDRLLAGAAIEDHRGSDPSWYRRDLATIPPPGAKPMGSKNPPKLRDGSLISDAVIEDRR